MPASGVSRLVATAILFSCAPLHDAAAQAANAGLLFEPTLGWLSYEDDSSSAARLEWKLQVGYRICVHCTASRSRIDIIPTIALRFTDVAGSSALDTETPAVGSLDLGLGVAYGLWRGESGRERLRLRLSGEWALDATAERTITEPAGAEFINYVGSGTMRWGAQLAFVCVRLGRFGQHTLTFGGSRADGAYDHYERLGEKTVLPGGVAYRGTSIALGVQSRLLRSDCH